MFLGEMFLKGAAQVFFGNVMRGEIRSAGGMPVDLGWLGRALGGSLRLILNFM